MDMSTKRAVSSELGAAGRNTPSAFEVHIEALVLHGFMPGDGYSIGKAVERELQRLFAEPGAASRLTRDSTVAHADGGVFEVAYGAKAATIGSLVAQAVYGVCNRYTSA
jgi:hypothetical protein